MTILNTETQPAAADTAALVEVLRGFGPARIPDLLRRCQLGDRDLLPVLGAALRSGRIQRAGDRYFVAETPEPTPAGRATALFNPHARLDEQTIEWLRRLRELAAGRPREHVEWHQRHVTLRSALLRPLYMHYRGDAVDRDLTFIGDADLSSIAAFLIGGFRSIRVLEADRAVLEFLIQTFHDLDADDVRIREFDARQPLPDDLYDSSDVVICDPSRRLYRCFFARAEELLRPGGAFYTFVNPSHSPDTGQFLFQRDAIAAGWVLTDSVPVLNETAFRAGVLSPEDQENYPFPDNADDAISFTETLVRFVRGPGAAAEEEIRRTVHDRED
ncbi:bis-aminopropyl spermidine synthase family protein [Nocardia sp. NPDC088792]|uniref:bis-aminopropyl spermidine synthase family protein n=1 Tax=Nocardia sp. NPDC088792 TaxID=3364332 RepID=UPI0037F4B7F8